MVNKKPDSRAANRALRGPTPRLQPQPLPGVGALGSGRRLFQLRPPAHGLGRRSRRQTCRTARRGHGCCGGPVPPLPRALWALAATTARGAEWLAHGRNADRNVQVTRGSTGASREREKGTAAHELSTGLRWFHLRTRSFIFLKLKDDFCIGETASVPWKGEPAVPHAFWPSEELNDHPNSSSAASSPVVLTGTPALTPRGSPPSHSPEDAKWKY